MTFWTIQNIGLRALWSDCTSTQWLLCFTESIKAMLTSWLYWELWLLSFMLRFKRKLIIFFGYKSGSLPGKVKLQQLMVEFREHTWAKREFIGLECKVKLTNRNLTISFICNKYINPFEFPITLKVKYTNLYYGDIYLIS